jgi:hypothetical protein
MIYQPWPNHPEEMRASWRGDVGCRERALIKPWFLQDVANLANLEYVSTSIYALQRPWRRIIVAESPTPGKREWGCPGGYQNEVTRMRLPRRLPEWGYQNEVTPEVTRMRLPRRLPEWGYPGGYQNEVAPEVTRMRLPRRLPEHMSKWALTEHLHVI